MRNKLGKRQIAILKSGCLLIHGVTFGWTTGFRLAEITALEQRGYLAYHIEISGWRTTDKGRKALEEQS